jgi:RimJ/RimL family protein N-acetyltransferase
MTNEKKDSGAAPEVREDLLSAGGVIEGPRDSEAREMAALTGELAALDKDIAAARAASEPARAGLAWHGAHETPAPSPHGERVVLRDAAEILIRPIEPGDASALESGLEHLSAMSRYHRFRAPVEHYSASELEWLTHVDHDRHEALVAIDPRTHTIIGVARYVCEPEDRSRALVTYVVADAWQGRRVGTALIERLAARARAAGIECLTARMLPGDHRARHLLAHVADELGERRDGGVAEITCHLRMPAP